MARGVGSGDPAEHRRR